jgi:hypothetical protein
MFEVDMTGVTMKKGKEGVDARRDHLIQNKMQELIDGCMGKTCNFPPWSEHGGRISNNRKRRGRQRKWKESEGAPKSGRCAKKCILQQRFCQECQCLESPVLGLVCSIQC